MSLDCIVKPPEDSFKPDTKLSLNVKARLVAEELAWQQLMLLLLVNSNLARFARWLKELIQHNFRGAYPASTFFIIYTLYVLLTVFFLHLKVIVHLCGRFMNKAIRPNAVPSSVTVVESHLIQWTPDITWHPKMKFSSHFPGQNVHPCICGSRLKYRSRQINGTLSKLCTKNV